LIDQLIGYLSMAFIITAYAITGRRLKMSQKFAFAGNFVYIIYGLMINQFPVIILGVILTCINAYTILFLRKKKDAK